MSEAADGCRIGNLIDFLPDSLHGTDTKIPTKDNDKDTTVEDSPGKSIPPVQRRNYGRLCGYLNKQGSRGLLKTFRKRWFVFSPDNCKLYYYKSSQDQLPLGEIDISKATFSFDVANKSKAGLFTISIPGKSYYLEANNRQTCLFWLQELQKFRRANSLLRTEQIREKSELHYNIIGKRPTSGLLGNVPSDGHSKEDDFHDSTLTIPVEFPCDSIGNAANDNVSNNPLTFAQQKLTNLKNQVVKSRHVKSSSESTALNAIADSAVNVRKSSVDMNLLPNSTFFARTSVSSVEDIIRSPSPPPRSGTTNFSGLRAKWSFLRNRTSDSDEPGPSTSNRLSLKNQCVKCQELNDKNETLLDEVSSLQDELSASRTVFKDLQKQLEVAIKDKETLTMLTDKSTDQSELVDSLSSRDQHIVHLTHDLLEQKQKGEKLQREVMILKKDLDEQQKQNDVFQEMMHRKDTTIINLTNEVFDLETEKQDIDIRRTGSKSSKSSLDDKSPESVPEEEEDIEYLKDAVKAFEIQNKFLNKEVLELNQLRSDSEQRELALIMKCSEWEARSCQIQSKLLYLLNELNKPDAEGRSAEVISRLLEEAMADSDTAASLSLPKWSIEKSYDDLGFNWKWGKQDSLSSKVNHLLQRSEDISKKEDLEYASWRAKWDNFTVAMGDKDLQRSPELKMLLRSGVPHEYKGKIWKSCVDSAVKVLKADMEPNYYQKLLDKDLSEFKLDPSSKQIELDLLRTLPNNRHYENIDSDGVLKLRRVLLAYSRHDQIVGYCQGLNRLAAIALLFMNEEDAFWCLVAIIQFLMPHGYYSRTLIAAQVDQKVLKDLMADKLPRLNSHLEQYNIDLSLFTFNWFLTIFVDSIPVETYLRIWDVFLFEGSKVLFRYALAFFKHCENDIMKEREYIAINRYLRSMAENMTDIKRISQIAFGELNPFPQKYIDVKRSHHLFTIKSQLDKLESIRNSLPRNPKQTLEEDDEVYFSEEES